MNQKHFTPIIIILSIVVVLVGISTYYLNAPKKNSSSENSSKQSNLSTYVNKDVGYSVEYPNELIVLEKGTLNKYTLNSVVFNTKDATQYESQIEITLQNEPFNTRRTHGGGGYNEPIKIAEVDGFRQESVDPYGGMHIEYIIPWEDGKKTVSFMINGANHEEAAKVMITALKLINK